MAWTTPVSKSQGDLISLATWNADVVANTQYLYDNNGILDAKVGRTLLAAEATFSYTPIASSYDDLILIMQLRGATAATSVTVNMRFNNDSGTNYTYQRLNAASSTVAGDVGSGATAFILGSVPAASATAGLAGAYYMIIPGYARTTFNKNVRSMGGGHNGTNYQVHDAHLEWANTAAITRIDIYPSTGNWAVGSSCAIFPTQSV